MYAIRSYYETGATSAPVCYMVPYLNYCFTPHQRTTPCPNWSSLLFEYKIVPSSENCSVSIGKLCESVSNKVPVITSYSIHYTKLYEFAGNGLQIGGSFIGQQGSDFAHKFAEFLGVGVLVPHAAEFVSYQRVVGFIDVRHKAS